MKYLLILALGSLLHGCLYFNDSGINSKLYDGCKEYYDDEGNYTKECPSNLVDYTEIQELLEREINKLTE